MTDILDTFDIKLLGEAKMDMVLPKMSTGVADHNSGLDILVRDKYAFCAGGKGMVVFDISDIKEPKQIFMDKNTGALSFLGAASQVFSEDGTYWVVGGNGLASYECKDPTNMTKLSTQSTGVCSHASGGELAISGKVLYVAGGKGLATFDISDPTKPERLFKSSTGVANDQGYQSICVVKNMCYFLGNKGLAIFDVTYPSKPNRLSKTVTGVVTYAGDRGKGGGGGGGSIKVVDGIAYIVGGMGFTTFDVTDPVNPKKLAQIKTGVGTIAGGAVLTVQHGLAFVAGGKGIAVLDVTDPEHPSHVAEILKTGSGSWLGREGIMLVGKYLFCAGGNGLSVVDVGSVIATEMKA